MEKMGYEMVAVTSPCKEFDASRKECPQFKTIEVTMERHISLLKNVKALMKMIMVMRREKPYMVHSMTPKAGLLSMGRTGVRSLSRINSSSLLDNRK